MAKRSRSSRIKVDDLDKGNGPLTEREHYVLDAVVRTYVDTAEPAASGTIAKGSKLGVSPATIRNTMADLEEKGYLLRPHSSAGRVPTDRAYRYFVDQMISPKELTRPEQAEVERALRADGVSAIEQLVRRAALALGLLTHELGVAVPPQPDDTILEKLDLVRASSSSVVMVATIKSGVVRTVFVDLRSAIPTDTLVQLTTVLNERLAGLSLGVIRDTVAERLRDSVPSSRSAGELLNIFIESGPELFDWSGPVGPGVHLGQASVLAKHPEFASGDDFRALIELTERPELLADVLGSRSHSGGLTVTIGGENASSELNEFSLVTAEYRLGNMTGVIGVIGPTRMPYEKVIAIVDYTSTLIDKIFEG